MGDLGLQRRVWPAYSGWQDGRGIGQHPGSEVKGCLLASRSGELKHRGDAAITLSENVPPGESISHQYWRGVKSLQESAASDYGFTSRWTDRRFQWGLPRLLLQPARFHWAATSRYDHTVAFSNRPFPSIFR